MSFRIHHPTIRLRGAGPVAVLGAVLLAAPACGGGDAPTGPRTVASVEIAPLAGDVWAGDIRQLHATPRAGDGSPLTERQVTWSSTNGQVAEVDAAGRLTARAAGSTTISATSEGKVGRLAVVVSDLDLLYEGYRAGLPEMFVLPLTGGEPARLLPPHTALVDPEPSPDGTRIAFVVADYQSGTGDIFVVDRDGTGSKQLTFDPELDDQPAWSPDGTKIVFRSYRTGRQGDIWVMNADGTNALNLTPDPLPATTDESRPAWSPDGTRIAYASNAAGNMDLWTMRADGTDKRRLTSTIDFDTEPTWSPDGLRVAFRRSGPEAGSDVMVIDAAGGEPARLAGAGHEVGPSWSPDGRFIAFALFQDVGGGSPQIYTMRPDGTQRTLRTSDQTWNGGRNPSWLRRRR